MEPSKPPRMKASTCFVLKLHHPPGNASSSNVWPTSLQLQLASFSPCYTLSLPRREIVPSCPSRSCIPLLVNPFGSKRYRYLLLWTTEKNQLSIPQLWARKKGKQSLTLWEQWQQDFQDIPWKVAGSITDLLWSPQLQSSAYKKHLGAHGKEKRGKLCHTQCSASGAALWFQLRIFGWLNQNWHLSVPWKTPTTLWAL